MKSKLKTKGRVNEKKGRIIVMPKAREKTFSSFRMGKDPDSAGGHRLEVRLPDQLWYPSKVRFDTRTELVSWLKNKLKMARHGDGPYLEDLKHPGKFPCWHSGISKHLDLSNKAIPA